MCRGLIRVITQVLGKRGAYLRWAYTRGGRGYTGGEMRYVLKSAQISLQKGHEIFFQRVYFSCSEKNILIFFLFENIFLKSRRYSSIRFEAFAVYKPEQEYDCFGNAGNNTVFFTFTHFELF